jgi:hypothetical protein
MNEGDSFMLFRKPKNLVLLVLSIFLLTLSAGFSDAKTSSKASKSPGKPWSLVNGFRTAKFGMDEKQVKRAIAKDFKISSSKIQKTTHITERTTSLSVSVPNLLAAGGTASIGYVLGQKSKKLIQVNVIWGAGAVKGKEKVDRQSIVGAANLLRDHFSKKRYQKDGFVLNGKINNKTLIVFRGKDKKGRMILLLLNSPITGKDAKPEEVEQNMSLRLSYQLDPESPDILTIKDGDF